ncbi:MAG: hypothetical protein IPJ71_02645 [Bdellovibrionales bacterium]|nr:hypothetical protein [Bdellovibrionales bacterium]
MSSIWLRVGNLIDFVIKGFGRLRLAVILLFLITLGVFFWAGGREKKDLVHAPNDPPLIGIHLAGAIEREFKNENNIFGSPLDQFSVEKQRLIKAISKSLRESVGFNSIDDVSGNTNHEDAASGDQNHIPVAIAGPDYVVTNETGKLTLDGRNSFDEDGDELDFAWYLVNSPQGATAAINEPNSPISSFTVSLDGTYWFSLVVSDGQLKSSPSVIKVTVQKKNLTPIAVISGPTRGIPNKELIFSGEKSFDPEHNPLNYSWKIDESPSKSSASEIQNSAPQTKFIPDIPGMYVVSLIVDNGTTSSPPHQHRLEVGPHFNGSVDLILDPDQLVKVGEEKTLTATIAGRVGDTTYQISWQLVSSPTSSSIGKNHSGHSMIFKADLPGHYLYRAFLKSNDEIIAHKTIHISAIPNMKTLPKDEISRAENRSDLPDHVYAHAGSDFSKCLAEKEIKIQSNNSYSTFKGELEYSWEIEKSPKKSDRAYILRSDTPHPVLVPDRAGEYTIQLQVRDRASSSTATDSVNISVLLDTMTFELNPFEWPSHIEKESLQDWLGVRVIYGSKLPLTERVQMKGEDEKLLLSFSSRIGEPGVRLAFQDIPTEGNQMLLSLNHKVSLPGSYELDRPYYFTYAYWHKLLGTPTEESDNPLFVFKKRRIDGLECFEITRK